METKTKKYFHPSIPSAGYCVKNYRIDLGCGIAAGAGGRGGKGGYSGDINLVNLSDVPNIVKLANDGIDGQNGKAGYASPTQREVLLEYKEINFYSWDNKSSLSGRTWKRLTDFQPTPNLSCIPDSLNTYNQKDPEPRTSMDTSAVIIEYLSLMQSKHINNHRLHAFLLRILNVRGVMTSFSTQGFLNLLLLLENQLLEHKDRVEFASYYRAISQGIEHFAENRTLSNEERKVSVFLL